LKGGVSQDLLACLPWLLGAADRFKECVVNGLVVLPTNEVVKIYRQTAIQCMPAVLQPGA